MGDRKAPRRGPPRRAHWSRSSCTVPLLGAGRRCFVFFVSPFRTCQVVSGEFPGRAGRCALIASPEGAIQLSSGLAPGSG
jgi:hypothetical protein